MVILQYEALLTFSPFEIVQMVNPILRKNSELEQEDKKLYAQGLQMLKQVYPILIEELAVSSNLTTEEVKLKINQLLIVKV